MAVENEPMFLVLLHKLGGEVTVKKEYAHHVCKQYGSVETIKGPGTVTYKILPRETNSKIAVPSALDVQNFGGN